MAAAYGPIPTSSTTPSSDCATPSPAFTVTHTILDTPDQAADTRHAAATTIVEAARGSSTSLNTIPRARGSPRALSIADAGACSTPQPRGAEAPTAPVATQPTLGQLRATADSRVQRAGMYAGDASRSRAASQPSAFNISMTAALGDATTTTTTHAHAHCDISVAGDPASQTLLMTDEQLASCAEANASGASASTTPTMSSAACASPRQVDRRVPHGSPR